MKVAQINATCGSGSTGNICQAISQLSETVGIENRVFYSLGKSDYPNGVKFGIGPELRFQSFCEHVFGDYGFCAKASTKRLLNQLTGFQPDILHLHNIHSHDVDLDMLFSYVKEKKTKVYWTFHDCWAFTGYCPHFDRICCEQWKTGCGNCPQFRQHSWFFDRSAQLYQKKAALFSGLDMTIITPSNWLAELVKQSFLGAYPVKVIHNGVDLTVFRPTKSDFRQKYHLEDKYILLGVAFGWGIRKGLDVFAELANRLDHRYQIVLVGTNDKIDRQLPANIISIHRTQNQRELAEIYTAADLFVNPTREDNYPTVNMEAIVCGTPVVTFHTGGSGEMLDESCGQIVEKNDIDALIQKIQNISQGVTRFKEEACLIKAKKFDVSVCFHEYIELYKAYENSIDAPIKMC